MENLCSENGNDTFFPTFAHHQGYIFLITSANKIISIPRNNACLQRPFRNFGITRSPNRLSNPNKRVGKGFLKIEVGMRV